MQRARKKRYCTMIGWEARNDELNCGFSGLMVEAFEERNELLEDVLLFGSFEEISD